MKTPTSLNDNVLYQIGEITRLAHKKISKVFSDKDFPVTVEQFSVLALLWYKEGVNQQYIADNLKRNKATITRIIENMIKTNLIVKVPDQLDKRNKLLFLTQKGKELQHDMVESSGSVYYEALENLQEHEIKSILTILKKITKNLE